ncbi:TetR/AcrR family transcriptional regulator [Demequina sp. NBRC 110055]|uniref:TetR/AcrR family transcriptional regulator n=1 Tax=Demequina sp. NBRC 110055 TaxID=1570344 RepID=UPI0009FBF74C|nr:TetR/AcrR family transcriptional regulator [Demequina sp. NBRC 110055]
MADGAGSGLRADAERNRLRLLGAAQELFAERGLDVSMRQIALHAGVGEPTLRRRFPTKETLIAAAFQAKITSYAETAEHALREVNPWDGFTSFVRALTAMQLGDRGFADVLTMTFPPSLRAESERRRAYAALSALVTRAQDADALRKDFTPEDVVLILMAHAGVVAGAGPLAPVMSARLVEYFLEAFAAPGARRLPAAPSPAQTYRAMLRLHGGASSSATEPS